MTKWKEYKLGEICDVRDGTHDSPKESPLGYPLVTSKNIKNGVIDLSNTYLISESDYNFVNQRSKVEQWDILFSMIGTIGECAIVKEQPNYAIKNVGLFKTDGNRQLAEWIYYYFHSQQAKNEINACLKGSTQQYISLTDLRNFPIEVPSNDDRYRMVSILTSLDDKIDLLRRENATLEAMAETLFRQWFVVEAKEEWEEGKLGNYVELVNGVSYKGDELQPSKVAMVTLKSFDRNGGFRMDGYKEFTGNFKREQVLHDGDLVVAHTDITQEADVIGNPAIIISKPQHETITFSMDVVKVVSKSELFTNSFLYYLMKTQSFKEHCLGYANGSTVLHLSKKAIPEFEFHVPPKEISHQFQEQVESINKKILNNNNEIQTLTQTRDGLLPRLMSGEIKV